MSSTFAFYLTIFNQTNHFIMKLIYNQILFALFFVLGATNVAFSQGSVSGVVKSTNGEAIPFATVEVMSQQNGAFTDAEGKYAIQGVPAGKVNIRVSAVGFTTATAEVEVMTGKDSQNDFSLGSDALGLSQVVVTGVANERSKLESSVSISTLGAQAIQNTGARTTAEIFRSITGIRAEASGGEGNTNIGSRGAPISSGGSKYLQLQEDGLPVLLFGDMAFATSDIFLRADNTVARIEAVRGGSASTMATNSPAGIINFISNTGAKKGGSIGTTFGVNYNQMRTDFNFGSPIGDGLSFNVGGFFRQGEGFRTAGYTANNGGQIKANLTKTFSNGYARIYYKYLNDHTAAYMPMPMKVTGTNANPIWGSFDNYNASTGTMHTPYLLQNFGYDGNGSFRNANVADGMNPNSNAIGAEFSFDLGDGWKVENRSRYSMNSGRFVAPFPADVMKAGALAQSVYKIQNAAPKLGGNTSADSLAFNTATASYNAAVAASNLQSPDGKTVNADSLAVRIHMFDTELNNFNNLVNDLKVSKKFGIVNATLGYFTATQNVNMSWLWNSYVTSLNGNGAVPLDVHSGAQNLSQNGQYAYGVPAWGNCCQRSYNTQNTVNAPYLNLGVEITEALNFDGSLRYDIGSARGTYAGNTVSARDINQDGVIAGPEKSVSVIDQAKASPVNYNYAYLSYSIGANYKINDNMAVFARHSQGGAAKADRILFGGDINAMGGLTQQKDASGAVLATARPYDVLTQTELGWKGKFDKGGLFVTAFAANADESAGYEATTQKYISNNYRAMGVETEAAFNFGAFDLRAGFTVTSAAIVSKDTSLDKKQPRRLSPFMFNLTPSYKFGVGHTVGLNIYGNTNAFAQDNNKLVMPGYAVVNLFANFAVTKSIMFGLSGNNLLNTIGVTEAEEGSITPDATNIVRGRSIYGRSVNASVHFNF
jgi:outer membrane receptor protein involved in Fe transport